MPKKSPTAILTEKIKSYLFSQGVFCWRNSTGAASAEYTNKDGVTKKRFMQFGKVGSGDILGFIPPYGRGLSVELKIDKDKPRPEQIGFHQSTLHVGALSIQVYGKTWEEAYQNFLDQWYELSTGYSLDSIN